MGTDAPTGSGWIRAPTIFLWIAYLPAKILNMIGVPDYLSILVVSILLTVMSLYLLKNLPERSAVNREAPQKLFLAVFFISSVFLWTSVGLRESFIIPETGIFLTGLNFLVQEKNKHALVVLFIGPYGLVSTKNYLWACLMVTVILSIVIFLFPGINRRKIIKLLIARFLVLIIAFGCTTSAYALDFIFHGGITDSSGRSTDSISQI